MNQYFLFAAVLLFSCSNKNKKETDHPPAQAATETVPSGVLQVFRMADSFYAQQESDSLEQLDRQITDTLIKYKSALFSMADTADYPFAFARSADKKFCLLSWNTLMGGTMIDYASMALYESGGIVKALRLWDVEGEDSTNPLHMYDTIATVTIDNKPVYLARGFGRGSSALPWEEVRAFSITGDSLSYPLLFPQYADEPADAVFSKTDYTNRTGIEYDLHNCDSNFYDIRPVIIFLNNSRRLKIPKVKDNGGNTKEYFSLELDGHHYIEKTIGPAKQ